MRKLYTDFLHPFSMEQITFLGTIAARMEEFGLSAGDVSEAVKEKIAAALEEMRSAAPAPVPERPMHNKRWPVCPDCGEKVLIKPVNVSRCTNVGGDWKTSIECSVRSCRYTELSLMSMDDWRRSNR